MNELRVNDPFAMEPMDAMFRNMLRPWRAELAERAPQIKLDVHESDASYTVKAEMPGVKKDDIDVRIDGNQVTISAEVKKDQEEKKDGRVCAPSATTAMPAAASRSPARSTKPSPPPRCQDGILRTDAAEEDQDLGQALAGAVDCAAAEPARGCFPMARARRPNYDARHAQVDA